MRTDKLEIADNEAVLITSFPNIFYYSNFSSEDANLIITKDRRILFTDSRYTVQAGIESPDFEVYDIFSQFETVVKSLNKEILLFEEDNVTVQRFSALQKLNLKLKPFSQSIKKPRYRKDTYEIENIKKAQEITDDAFLYILNFIKPGISEKSIALELEYFMKKNGAEKIAFETVCASGVRSSMPHGTASGKLIENGDFVTLDFGCVIGGYCSDMTRTVAVGYATDEMCEIYNIVLSAQKRVLDNIAINIPCKSCDAFARDFIEQKGYGKNFGHATGHSVGIEIHECPNLSSRSSEILCDGNVVTVEPGIYIDSKFGVRIEDLVQITPENAINLTKSQKDLLII